MAHVSFLGMELNCFHGNIFGEKGFGKYQVLFALLPIPHDRHTCDRMQTLDSSPNCSPECINPLKNQFVYPFRTDAVNKDVLV